MKQEPEVIIDQPSPCSERVGFESSVDSQDIPNEEELSSVFTVHEQLIPANEDWTDRSGLPKAEGVFSSVEQESPEPNNHSLGDEFEEGSPEGTMIVNDSPEDYPKERVMEMFDLWDLNDSGMRTIIEEDT